MPRAIATPPEKGLAYVVASIRLVSESSRCFIGLTDDQRDAFDASLRELTRLRGLLVNKGGA